MFLAKFILQYYKPLKLDDLIEHITEITDVSDDAIGRFGSMVQQRFIVDNTSFCVPNLNLRGLFSS